MRATRLPVAAVRWYAGVGLVWKFAAALLVGAALGLTVDAERLGWLVPFGDLFLRLLQLVIIPVVMFTLAAGLAVIEPAKLGRVGMKVLGYYLLTTAIAVTIGLLLASLVRPGAGLKLPTKADPPDQPPPLAEVLLGIVPDNAVAAMVEGNVLSMVFIAAILGLCASRLCASADEARRRTGQGLRSFFESGAMVTQMVVRGVLEYGPFGVFALTATSLAAVGAGALVSLAKLIGVVYSGIGVQLVLYTALLLAFRVGLREFAKAARLPLLTGFVTRSSTGTLPVTLAAAGQMGVPRSISSFTLPLGATVNMDGTALYIGASVVFTANVVGVDLGFVQLLTVIAVATLASIGTVAVPSAGLIMLGVALQQAGLPFAAVALIAGVDAFLDMGRTMCNIAGDLTGARVIAATERADVPEQAPVSQGAAAGSVQEGSA